MAENQNTSATGGPLLPDTNIEALEGEALVDFIQGWVVGLTGLDGDLVRPRWQAEPANIPDEDQTWVGIGVVSRETDLYHSEIHHPNEEGFDEIRKHQELTVLSSFYGPDADYYLGRLRDGMMISQNREYLLEQRFDVVGPSNQTVVPELIKGKWLYRSDLSFTLRRQIVRYYPILNLNSAEVMTISDDHTTFIEIVE